MKILSKSNKNKPKELKKDTLQKLLKYSLWILLLFLVVKSVVGDVFEPEIEFEIPEIKFDQQKPAAIATSFVKEYLTYDIQKNLEQYKDYERRIHSFSADYIKVSRISNVTVSSKVENLYIYEINKLNENQYDISIKADVKYTSVEGDIKYGNLYLKVPVKEVEGTFLVEDTPIFIPPIETEAYIDYIRFNQGEELYITEVNKAKSILENFFKTYFTGNKEEIAYYMSDGKPTKGFEGRFTFLDIRELHVYDLGTDNIYKAIVELHIKDNLSNKEYYQNCNLDLIKKDKRWYVKNINIRGGNIYENYDNEREEK